MKFAYTHKQIQQRHEKKLLLISTWPRQLISLQLISRYAPLWVARDIACCMLTRKKNNSFLFKAYPTKLSRTVGQNQTFKGTTFQYPKMSLSYCWANYSVALRLCREIEERFGRKKSFFSYKCRVCGFVIDAMTSDNGTEATPQNRFWANGIMRFG